MNSDLQLTQLAEMWEERDPMPVDLVDRVLVALALDDLDAEYEMLHLIERSRDLVGTRSVAEAVTITFAAGEFTVMLHVSPTTPGQCRVDGWVAPAQPMTVKIVQPSEQRTVRVDATGRFSIADLAMGLTRFVLETEEDEPGRQPKSFATPLVELS
ncbi:MAG TPA: hypothetical protein VEX15_01890 [Nocardioidaceae bacterium]|nr:hypothetical protein [Nocardioidaceae bacterium]